MPAAMTAHVVYTTVDSDQPASTSAKVTTQVIREHIGFGGLLMSDDLGMKALAGPMQERTRAVLAAGSDLALHCSGDWDEMQLVASAAPALTGAPLARFERALDVTCRADPVDVAAAEQALHEALQATA
jgi:beta-N-acetylhexosaminidase